jgi:hypothetical protein
LALVPVTDWTLGVLEHLGIGRASGRDLSVGFGLSASLHLAGIEAHGRIVSDFISL